MDFFNFLLTMAFAFAGGYAAHRLKLPAGPMVGAILGVVLLNLTIDRAYYYADIKVVLQILSGAMIGSKIGRKDVAEIRTLILPTFFLLGGMVILNLTFGGLIYKFSSLDVATALFSTAPGGMSDMALIASDLGANTAYVGILQVFRVLIIFIFLPPIFKRILAKKWSPKMEDPKGESAVPSPPLPEGALPLINPGFQPQRFALLLIASAFGGLLLRQFGVPAGALTGGMLASAGYCVWRGRVAFPRKLKFFMQVFAGAFIGLGIDRSCVETLPALFVPVLIMLVGILVFVFATAFLMHKLLHVDLAVCLLSSTPGGVQEMSLLSEDLHADTPKIAIMQTTRLMCVIIFFPTMLRLVTDFFA